MTRDVVTWLKTWQRMPQRSGASPMQRLRATRAFRLGGRNFAIGDEVELPVAKAAAFLVFGRAALVESQRGAR